MQEHSFYLTPGISSFDLSDWSSPDSSSNIGSKVNHRQNFVPLSSSQILPYRVKPDFCSQTAFDTIRTTNYLTRKQNLESKFNKQIGVIYENRFVEGREEKDNVSLKNVLSSDSGDSSLSKYLIDDFSSDGYSQNGKYLESLEIVNNWDDSSPFSFFSSHSVEEKSDSVSLAICQSLDHDTGSVSGESHDETKNENAVVKKTRFKIDELKQDSDNSESHYETLDIKQDSSDKQDCNTDDKTELEVKVTSETEETENDGSKLNEILETSDPPVININNQTCSSPVKSPHQTPSTPSSPGILEFRGLFLKCKTQSIDTSCVTMPSSALPCSDYGGVSHTATHPQQQQTTKRGPFSRSLSNADVPADEHGGKNIIEVIM